MGKWEVLKPPCYLEAGPAHSLLYQFCTMMCTYLNQLVPFDKPKSRSFKNNHFETGPAVKLVYLFCTVLCKSFNQLVPFVTLTNGSPVHSLRDQTTLCSFESNLVKLLISAPVKICLLILHTLKYKFRLEPHRSSLAAGPSSCKLSGLP